MIQYKNSVYRPDIDGLRAIAVIAVVFFHAAKNTLKGGFVGVDVFFVISGFLITGILLKSFTTHNVDSVCGGTSLSLTRSIISFYARRVRRIFPVLIVVLISCGVAGWLFMTPDEYQLLGKHIAGGSVYISNIVLWNELGYFDVDSEVKPLLHLWSLGIEEQFYIVWPFFILILLKLRLRLETFLLLFVVASCGLNIIMVKTQAAETFYLPLTRFWELAIGGVLASLYYRKDAVWEKIAFKSGGIIKRLVYSTPPQSGNEIQISKDILSVLGLLLILVSIFSFHSGIHFPGKKALIPTLGAFFIIAAGEKAVVNRRLLSLNFMVFIGLISYPLYLWHWPLLSYARILYGAEPPLSVRICLVILALLLSWATYRFIEPPLRYGQHGRIKAICLFLTLLIIGFGGICIYKNYGFPKRVGYTVQEIQDERNISFVAKNSYQNCKFSYPEFDKYYPGGCRLQKKNGNNIAIFGDSHAERLFRGLSEQFIGSKDKGVALFYAPGQAPFFDISTATNLQKNNYRHFLIEKGYELVFHDDTVKTVILSHYPYRGNKNPFVDITDPNNKNTTLAYSKSMKKTFDLLARYNKKVIVVLDNALLPFSPNICKPRPIDLLKKNASFCFIKRRDVESQEHLVWFNSLLKEIVSKYNNVILFDTNSALCDDEICPILRNGRALYDDSTHLSNEGSRLVSQKLIELIDS